VLYDIKLRFQGGALDGSKTGSAGVIPDQLTDSVWDYIMLKRAPFPTISTIPKATLDRLKSELSYFYPMDLRVSGKDLIGNHLTFSIYNHVAIFDESEWPRAIRANGHLLINNEKMSKSTGNFLTLSESIDKFSADGTRFALAQAGDGVDDANFEMDIANAGILKLFTVRYISFAVANRSVVE
jgi:leucyl-tRNA synthetase